MRGGLGDENEIGANLLNDLANRLPGHQVITQIDGSEPGILRAMSGQPAAHGAAFAVLLLVAVSRRDELRLKRQDAIVPRRHHRGRKHGMIMLLCAVRALAVRAARAAQIPAGEELGAVQRDQKTPVEPAKSRQPTALRQRSERIGEQGKQMIRADRIEHLADVIVGRDLVHAEQRPAVRPVAAVLQRALMSQEGRALHEKHRERRQPYIGHGIAAVVSRAFVGKRRAAFAKGAYQRISEHPQ